MNHQQCGCESDLYAMASADERREIDRARAIIDSWANEMAPTVVDSPLWKMLTASGPIARIEDPT